MAAKALEGIRIVEFTDEIGSYCGRLLADLGADVIKIEPPSGGRLRNSPPFASDEPDVDRSIPFWTNNMSKRSVVADLETDEGVALAKRVAASADVILEDLPPGYLAKKGLGFAGLSPGNPALVYTSVTGFGQVGPHSQWAYTDMIGQAMGGLMTLSGDPADPPSFIYGNQANLSASGQAAQGTLLAVLHAEATGEGQTVEVSAQEAVSMSQETAMQQWDLQKTNRVRTGAGGGLPIALPGMGVLKTADGYVFSAIMLPAGADFPDLIDWMREEGKIGDLDDPAYRDLAGGLDLAYLGQLLADPKKAAEGMKALGHVGEVVKEFFLTMTSQEAYEESQERRLLVGIVSTPESLAQNVQLRARDWFDAVDFGGEVGVKEFPGPPYRLSVTPAEIGPPPNLGQHTDEVLKSLESKQR